MVQHLYLHPETPQTRLLEKTAAALREGAVIAFPTDSCYALACHLGDKQALDKIRAIRGIDDRHHLTLMCRDLSEIAKYARVDNAQYRLLKMTTPGPYTFILEGTKELPRRIMHPKRKTLGLRIPDHVLAQALLTTLNEPLLTCTLSLPGDDAPLCDGFEIADRLENALDLLLDIGDCGTQATTVIDLSSGTAELIRAGRGSLEPFGLSA